MKSIIEWQTGEPTEFGFYLTVRKSRVNGNTRVDINQWAKDDLMKSPLPKTCPQGWQMKSPDCCDIVAWVKLDDISVSEEVFTVDDSTMEEILDCLRLSYNSFHDITGIDTEKGQVTESSLTKRISNILKNPMLQKNVSLPTWDEPKMCINCKNRRKECDFFMPDAIVCSHPSNQEGKNRYQCQSSHCEFWEDENDYKCAMLDCPTCVNFNTKCKPSKGIFRCKKN